MTRSSGRTTLPHVFTALPPRPSAVDLCVEELRRRILAGELPAGERLPPERDLASTLGTSRVTLRSALGRLAASKLLSVKHGTGYVVRDFRRSGGPDILPPLLDLARGHQAVELARDLLLVRRHLAAAVLERLSGGISRAALQRILQAIDALEVLAREGAGTAALAEADLEVVAALLAATRSPALQLCLNPIVAVLSGMPALRDAMYATPEANVLGWRMLAEWARTGERAAISLVLAELERRDEATLHVLAGRKK